MIERSQRHAFLFPEVGKCRVQTIIFFQLLDELSEVGNYVALIFFEFHSLKSFDVAWNLLEYDVFRRQICIRQRTDVGVNDILLGSFRHDM